MKTLMYKIIIQCYDPVSFDEQQMWKSVCSFFRTCHLDRLWIGLTNAHEYLRPLLDKGRCFNVTSNTDLDQTLLVLCLPPVFL